MSSSLMKILPLLAAFPVLGVQSLKTQSKSKVTFRRGHPSELERDELFKMSWAESPSKEAHVARENCESFVGNGIDCWIEAPEHTLARKWIPHNATVMEFGARFGTTTCEIAKQLKNSGKLVTVEPDTVVWGWLESNLKTHDCHAHVLRGALGSSPVRIMGSGYGGRSAVGNLDANHGTTVPTFTFDEIEKASGLKFDTLLIDCEGCAQDMMDQIGPKIKTTINTIVLEADMPANVGGDCTQHCMDYQKFFAFLSESGFEQVDEFNDCNKAVSGAPASTWCGPWINHYAFRRVSKAH